LTRISLGEETLLFIKSNALNIAEGKSQMMDEAGLGWDKGPVPEYRRKELEKTISDAFTLPHAPKVN
jgi:hypothetical protein